MSLLAARLDREEDRLFEDEMLSLALRAAAQAQNARTPQGSRRRSMIDGIRRLLGRPSPASSGPPATNEPAPDPLPSTAQTLGQLRRRERAASNNKGALLIEECSPCPEEDCPICLCALDTCVITPCQHKFHSACLERYFLAAPRDTGEKARCPLCRGSVHAPLPIEASARSGRPIEVGPVPAPGGRCHFDRRYFFHELGSFDWPGMLYVLTSNDDRKTPSNRVMWEITSVKGMTVHLNFRSEEHVRQGNAEEWLRRDGWERNTAMRSTRSSGEPNGPCTPQRHYSHLSLLL